MTTSTVSATDRAARPLVTRVPPRTAWARLAVQHRAGLLALTSERAVDHSARLDHTDPDRSRVRRGARDVGRSDQLFHDVARITAVAPIVITGRVGLAVHPTAIGSVELIVDDGVPAPVLALQLAATIVAGNRVALGVPRSVGPIVVQYLERLAVLLPAGVLSVRCGERLVSGGHDRSIWLGVSGPAVSHNELELNLAGFTQLVGLQQITPTPTALHTQSSPRDLRH
ncbi:hypothetical protein [Curtobacterium sp. VKM Ac-1393]|uniref:hypothetical protein n=1 Tax=Curtobacterium sp. VKM Ac-1393 TaxID=2783814 RepID=UPI00188D161C|nr:hypothetical protein [Curtobacterium sp. VKM Ac-1393]MBF4606896.1 hypothetical protein [Curtobacterium sp. VKM Ac-1393]